MNKFETLNNQTITEGLWLQDENNTSIFKKNTHMKCSEIFGERRKNFVLNFRPMERVKSKE